MIPVYPNQINFNLEQIDASIKPFLYEILEIFMNNLRINCGKFNCKKVSTSIIINLVIESSCLDLNWETQENYYLEILSKGRI